MLQQDAILEELDQLNARVELMIQELSSAACRSRQPGRRLRELAQQSASPAMPKRTSPSLRDRGVCKVHTQLQLCERRIAANRLPQVLTAPALVREKPRLSRRQVRACSSFAREEPQAIAETVSA